MRFIGHCASYGEIALVASAKKSRSTFSGVILAGGLSSRMGHDKALLPVPGTDLVMIEAVYAALSKLTTDIVIVGPQRDGYDRFGGHIVADEAGPPGPLRGIAAGLRASRHEWVFVLACDLPFVNVRLLRWMVDQRGDADAIVPVTAGSSRQGGTRVYQTLHAMYRQRCLPLIEAQLAAGDGRTTAFFGDITVKLIEEHALRNLDPQLRSFANINAPTDWPIER